MAHPREHTVNGNLMEGKIFSLLLNGESLEEVAQFEYFGVTITDDLSWSKQVSSVVSKARRILDMPQILPLLWYLNIFKAVQTYVKPHHNYCSLVWDLPLVNKQEALESVHTFALRFSGRSGLLRISKYSTPPVLNTK